MVGVNIVESPSAVAVGGQTRTTSSVEPQISSGVPIGLSFIERLDRSEFLPGMKVNLCLGDPVGTLAVGLGCIPLFQLHLIDLFLEVEHYVPCPLLNR